MNELDYAKIIANVIEKNAGSILNFVKDKYKDSVNKSNIDYGTAFDNYLTKAYDKYSKIKTILYKDTPKYLYSFFECSSIELGENEIDCSDVDNILNISHFNIITGTGGIGKTTQLKHFFLNQLEKGSLIPIFFELKNLNDNNDKLLDCIYNSMYNLGFNLEKKYLEYALESGQFLILLDGYDEIKENRTSSFFKEITALCDKYDKNYYILSSRPNSDFISWQRFYRYEALPFSKEQAISLISKIEYGNDIKERFIEKLDTELYDSHKSFASNPLLLTIMFLNFEQYAEVPDKLHIFYSQAFETLYNKHDATKGLYKREMKSKLTFDDFRDKFAYFCFRTYLKSQLEFTYDELKDYFQNPIKKENITFDIDNYIYDLLNSVCMLCLEGLKYTFTHRSFQEYFTAVYLKNLNDEQQAKSFKYLIDNQKFMIRHEMVFNMIFDISQDRFEKNVIIPFLRELKEAIGQSDDIYKSYFIYLFERIGFRKIGKRIILSTRGDNSSGKRSFLNWICRHYELDNNTLIYDDALQDNLIKKYKFRHIECDIILRDETFYSYVKNNSWIGVLIQNAISLLPKLEKKHKQSNDELEALFV